MTDLWDILPAVPNGFYGENFALKYLKTDFKLYQKLGVHRCS